MNVIVMYYYDSEVETFDLIGVADSIPVALEGVVRWCHAHEYPEQDWLHWAKDDEANEWRLGPFCMVEVTVMDGST